MSTKLDDLFAAAAGPSAGSPDADRLWKGGRRRRRLRQGGAALLTVAVLAVGGVVGTSLLTEVGTPTVDPAATPDVTVPEPEPADRDVAADRRGEELRELDEYLYGAEQEAAAEAEDEAEAGEDAEAEADEQPTPTTGPEPSGARMADPCAAHRGGEPRAFIDVVSPVSGQQASGSVELVGCSSVYEGTVRYRLSGPGGVLTDSFTTASAGGPEVGDFRETLALGGSGQHTLEVFWTSPKDGSEADKTTIVFEAR